jgi:peptide/nickel transport system substrate-binding protein
VRLLGQGTRLTCQTLPPYIPGYQRYCPYTLDPNPAGIWHGPDLAKAERLIALSHTRGTPITIYNLGQFHLDYTPAIPYLVALLERLGYPTRVKDLSTEATPSPNFADSRAKAQAAIGSFGVGYLSPSQLIKVNFACGSYTPDSTGNANLSESCDPRLDSEIQRALAAEGNNSPDVGSLWAQADRTVTDDAPWVPLTTQSTLDFVSPRVGNYQYSFQQGVLVDQLWVR